MIFIQIYKGTRSVPYQKNENLTEEQLYAAMTHPIEKFHYLMDDSHHREEAASSGVIGSDVLGKETHSTFRSSSNWVVSNRLIRERGIWLIHIVYITMIHPRHGIGTLIGELGIELLMNGGDAYCFERNSPSIFFTSSAASTG